MAKQVRPGLINPCGANGPQESAEVIRNQPAYSIRARDLASHSQAGCMAAISSCEPELKKNAWQLGASIVRCECNRDGSGSNASSKMRVGPSGSAYRSWPQITSSCVG